MLKYKGYTGYTEFDDEAEIFHGEVLNTRDVITFESENSKEIKNAFKESVDDYLEFCQERNEKPEKPFSGKLVLRMPEALHHEVFIHAKHGGKSINTFINDTLRKTTGFS
jgi:predicted HicB family RNase H-like nuclease